MIETKIIDNFYDVPSLIRKYALEQDFYKRIGQYPGLRTKPINELDYEFYINFVRKLVSVYYDIDKFKIEFDVKTLFQWADKKYNTGWVHQDDINYYDVAGVVYLSPNAPLNCGTSLYVPNVDKIERYRIETDPFTENENIDINLYQQEQIRYNSQFKKIKQIENIYNRLVVYDCKQWHAQDGFFGETKEDSRLIQVFFARIRPC
jgi:hypothetical protein